MKIILALLLAMPLVAAAQDLSAPVALPGNLPADFYPKSPCIKPDANSIGYKPRDARDVKAVDDYNKTVQAHNRVANAFNACIQDYAAKAQNDIARIQAAIRDANAH